MNGYDIFNKTISLLGISEDSDLLAEDGLLLKRAIHILQYICRDLDIKVVENLSDEINIRDTEVDACVCGMAMLISLTLGDFAANRTFTELYNNKRAFAKSKVNIIADVLPIDDGGSAL